MSFKIWLISLIFFGSRVAIAAEPGVVGTLPRLPSLYQKEMILKMEHEFKRRNKIFLGNKDFVLWEINKPTEEIINEFEQLQKWRQSIWYADPTADTVESQPDFMISQELAISGRYRYPRLIAFEYNNTDPSYNSSTIMLNGLHFLALEAPSQQTVKHFNYLVHNHKVTHLVRLTPEFEKDVEKSFAYWKNNLTTHDGVTYLKIPLDSDVPNQPYIVRYAWTDTWIDHASGDPQQLLEIIMQVRDSHQSSSLIAVHCHSGVARTGTFIAAFVLIHEVDCQRANGIPTKDIKISIEKTVKQLSLQRFYMVGQPTQYVTLYRLVDHYLKSLD